MPEPMSPSASSMGRLLCAFALVFAVSLGGEGLAQAEEDADVTDAGDGGDASDAAEEEDAGDDAATTGDEDAGEDAGEEESGPVVQGEDGNQCGTAPIGRGAPGLYVVLTSGALAGLLLLARRRR
jgi:hypothetical protein